MPTQCCSSRCRRATRNSYKSERHTSESALTSMEVICEKKQLPNADDPASAQPSRLMPLASSHHSAPTRCRAAAQRCRARAWSTPRAESRCPSARTLPRSAATPLSARLRAAALAMISRRRWRHPRLQSSARERLRDLLDMFSDYAGGFLPSHSIFCSLLCLWLNRARLCLLCHDCPRRDRIRPARPYRWADSDRGINRGSA